MTCFAATATCSRSARHCSRTTDPRRSAVSVDLEVDGEGTVVADAEAQDLDVAYGRDLDAVAQHVVELHPRTPGGVRRRAGELLPPGRDPRHRSRQVEVAD